MIYKNYLERVLGNKTKVSMLRVFSRIPEKVWSSRDLARFIGTYNSTILDNLGDLEDMGLLGITMHGGVKQIKVNRESFLFNRIIKPLFTAENEALEALKNEIKEAIKPDMVSLALLFGSIVENKERPNSDIDLLIITNDKRGLDKPIMELQNKISREFGNELSPIIMKPEEFKSKQGAPFIKEANKRHIILYGEWL